MFNKTKKPAGIDLVMDLVTEELLTTTPGTIEYAKIVEQLERLNKIASTRKSDPISKDGLIAVIGNLAGIGFILYYEQLHVITSKAVGFVVKSRV